MEPGRQSFTQWLLSELQRHPVNSNTFFTAFETRQLTLDQLRTFLSQYQYFCKHFVKLLEGLLYKTPVEQVEMRVELVKTLHSELGDGRVEQAHITLLNRFAKALGLHEADLEATVPIPAVATYLLTLHRLFIESGYLVALGAETAVEVTAVSEFEYLYSGLKNNMQFRDDDLIFFKMHLKEEQCHSQWLLAAVEQTARTDADRATVAAAAQETAEAWHAFWLGLYREVFGRSVDAAA